MCPVMRSKWHRNKKSPTLLNILRDIRSLYKLYYRISISCFSEEIFYFNNHTVSHTPRFCIKLNAICPIEKNIRVDERPVARILLNLL